MNTRRILSFIFTISCLFLVSIEATNEDDDYIVQTSKGKIRGRYRKSAKGNEYYTFQDIPYGVPPIGENRFQIPRPHEGWNGILNTTDNLRACMGATGPPPFMNGAIMQTEDCLYLNVYTPVKPGSNESLAVFVFIHGGAFKAGNGAFARFGPKYLMDHDIIVVTINYRLGVFGFLTTTDGVIPGNLGLRDQSLALKWVQENIEQFGGNPQKVTVGGESAGAVSVGYQLISQQSKGSFSSIILQSGTAINTWGFQSNPDGYALKLGNILDKSFDSLDSERLLSILMRASADDINRASDQVLDEEALLGITITDLIWAPTIEDDNLSDTFISENMYDDLEKGKFNQVPIMIGFTDEEALPFFREEAADVAAKLFDENKSLLVNDKFHLDPYNRSIMGSELYELYTRNSTFKENISALVRFTSDSFMTRSTIRHAEITSRYVPTYLFQFSYGGEEPRKFPDTGKVGHSQEMRFIWEKTQFNDTKEFDSVMRERTLILWTNFVKYHNPTPTRDPLLMNTVWPTVQPGKIIYLNIDENFSLATNPRHYDQLKSILDKHVHSPLATY